MISAGQKALASDFLNFMSSTTMATVVSGSTMMTITTDPTQRLTIVAKGDITTPGGTGGSPQSLSLTINGTIVDTIVAQNCANTNGGIYPFCFIVSRKWGSTIVNTLSLNGTATNVTVLAFVLDSN